MLIDETGLFLNPLVRRSWSLVGDTPVVGGDGGPRKKVSAIGAVSVSPTARRLGFYFATEVGGYFSADKVVAFLRDRLEHLRGKVVVIWHGGPNHHGPVIRAFAREEQAAAAGAAAAVRPRPEPGGGGVELAEAGAAGQLRARRPARPIPVPPPVTIPALSFRLAIAVVLRRGGSVELRAVAEPPAVNP